MRQPELLLLYILRFLVCMRTYPRVTPACKLPLRRVHTCKSRDSFCRRSDLFGAVTSRLSFQTCRQVARRLNQSTPPQKRRLVHLAFVYIWHTGLLWKKQPDVHPTPRFAVAAVDTEPQTSLRRL
uniref:Secreted protein n=1 Tax=Ixodes ricinus TaxID=34613 RepID=A0A147BN96_IXORI